ncbi:hypothetical protein GCM10018955_01980 [Planomonospora venezuelensis]
MQEFGGIGSMGEHGRGDRDQALTFQAGKIHYSTIAPVQGGAGTPQTTSRCYRDLPVSR